jgi:hypothetical protein
MVSVPWKKEIGAMRMKVIIFVTAVLLTGCVHLGIKKNIDALKQVQPGDSQTSVFSDMGPPDLRNDITDRRFVVFYRTKAGGVSDTPVTPDLCTPIAFEDGLVVEVGNDLTDQWTREEADRARQAEIDERQRQEFLNTQSAQRQAEKERQDKIAILEEKVKPIPASNAALNLKLYHQLLELDPENPRYHKKVAFYEERLARQKEVRQNRAAQKAKERHRREWEQARDTRNKKLRQYTGNGIAEMAVHDMGSGSLYVWVKNISDQIITTHPDYFKLVDSDGNTVRCEISSSLDTVLEPGSISHGKIQYDKQIEPKELIFQNRESGRISKSFH